MQTVKILMLSALIYLPLFQKTCSIEYTFPDFKSAAAVNIMPSKEFHIIIPTPHTHLGLSTVLSRNIHFYLNYLMSFITIYGGSLFLQLFDLHLTHEQISKATQIWSAYYMGRELFRDFYYGQKTTLWDFIILTILTAQYWFYHKHIIEGTLIPKAHCYSRKLSRCLGSFMTM